MGRPPGANKGTQRMEEASNEEIERALEGAPAAASGRIQITKVRYSHDAMIDMIIANPAVSQNELGAVFGYSASWISTVMGTDMFQARLAQRRAETVDPVIIASLEERVRGLVSRSIEVLEEKLSKPAGAVPDTLALRAFELGAKAMGLGGNAPPRAPDLPLDHLQNLAKRLEALGVRQPSQGVLDVQARQIPSAA